MRYRRLGITNLKVSVIGIGTWQYGGEWGKTFAQSEVDAILGRAQDLGINLIDSAECYGDHLSEALIGQAIRGQRDHWILATKFGHGFHGAFQRTEHWSPAEVLTQLEDSLRALQTEYIDIYQAHGDQAIHDEELWQMLQGQVQAGKIRHVGVSLRQDLRPNAAQQSTRLHVECIQVIYNRLDRRAEAAVFPACQEHGLGVLARVPLASGLLSGKYQPGTQFNDPTDTRHQHEPIEVEDRLRQVEEIRRSEVPTGANMATWALAWCLRQPIVSCVIPGVKSVAQLAINAAASDLVA